MDLDKLFRNIDYFAECASKVDIKNYKNCMRSDCVYSHDATEQGAYFCAISKRCCNSLETAVPILFINSLYDTQEWPKDEKPWKDNFHRDEWKENLKKLWIPEYFSCKVTGEIPSIQVDRIDGFPINDKILDIAIPSPALLIVRYGDVKAWNSFDYLIETKDEYIFFQSWTTA